MSKQWARIFQFNAQLHMKDKQLYRHQNLLASHTSTSLWVLSTQITSPPTESH